MSGPGPREGACAKGDLRAPGLHCKRSRRAGLDRGPPTHRGADPRGPDAACALAGVLGR